MAEAVAMTGDERTQILRENGSKPVHITREGRICIGDQELLHPVVRGSVKVEPHSDEQNGFNLLHLTLIVGEVTMESRKMPAS